jgi:hypothetical protein
MPLDLTNTLNHIEWCKTRSIQKEKWFLANHLKKFNNVLFDLKDKYDGHITYYDTAGLVAWRSWRAKPGDAKFELNLPEKYMSYGEGSPVAYFFKFVIQDYLCFDYDDKGYWKKYDIKEDVINYLLSVRLDKWPNMQNPEIKINFDHDYILYAMQKPSRDWDEIVAIAKYAKQNKQHIVFKPHPFYTPFDGNEAFQQLQEEGLTSEYTILAPMEGNTNYLVDNCKLLITPESGVGMHGLLIGKPVIYTQRMCDYSWHIAATYRPDLAKTINDINLYEKLPYEEVMRYFSWYYDKFFIDISRDNYKEKIEERMYQYFVEGVNPHVV